MEQTKYIKLNTPSLTGIDNLKDTKLWKDNPEIIESELMEYSVNPRWFGAKGDGTSDDTAAIMNGITHLKNKGGGTLKFGNGTFKFSQTIELPERIRIVGTADDDNVSNLKYTGTGFAFQTKDFHLRNVLKDISLNLNYGASGIKIGQAQADRSNGKIPRQSKLENVRIGELGVGFYGVRLENASHVHIQNCRLAYGNGGIGLSIWNDNCNAGVVTVVDSSLGRVNESQVGLEIDSPFQVGLDSYSFVGCYFGGNVPIRLGLSGTTRTNVRNVSFLNSHIETTTSTNQGTSAVYAIQIGRADGVIFNGLTIVGFGDSNLNGFRFIGNSQNISITGLDINEFQGKVFINDGGYDLDNSMIQEPSVSGANSTGYVLYNGNFDYVTRIGRRLKHRNIEATYYYGSTGNKTDWGTQSPTLDAIKQAWTKGDFRHNSEPSELGATGSKYVVLGWKCLVSGTAGTWVEVRGYTGG